MVRRLQSLARDDWCGADRLQVVGVGETQQVSSEEYTSCCECMPVVTGAVLTDCKEKQVGGR